MIIRLIALLTGMLALLSGCETMSDRTRYIAEPLIVAHRGASAERPEHTLEAYQRAIDQGADYIEPDLVMTRDGVFVARHENEISATTDVADHPEFASRRTTKMIDGQQVTGWFTEDFTLAELKTLRARERIPELRGSEYDGRYEIPTLGDILSLVHYADHPVGIAPELKHPSYFRSIRLPMERALVDQLAEAGYDDWEDNVLIQCFEPATLERLHHMTDIRLLQLIGTDGGPYGRPALTFAQMTTPAGLAAIARYAQAIGPDKSLLIPRTDGDLLGEPTTLTADAHAAGLMVIPWAFRPENYFLPTDMRRGADPRTEGALRNEIVPYLALGIDGLFTDYVPEAFEVREAMRR